MKKILEILKLKWAEYLVEVIAIVIGILGAFALESWNETQIDHDRADNILKQIQDDIILDKRTLESDINWTNQFLETLWKLEDMSPDKLPDSLSYLLENAYRITEWSPIVTGYSSYLKLGGDIVFPKILNEKISNSYTSFLRNTNMNSAQDLSLYALNQYRQLLIEYGFPITRTDYGIRPPKSDKLMRNMVKDPRFIGVIRNYQFTVAGQRDGYNQSIKLIEELNMEIDKYFMDN